MLHIHLSLQRSFQVILLISFRTLLQQFYAPRIMCTIGKGKSGSLKEVGKNTTVFCSSARSRV